MPSIIPGFEHDIFISYRQKDNKYDGWVTEFADNLQKELEATFKEEISVYFDVNPHNGLLETHDVDASLKEKLKCLIFIPIISRTYCDARSFAWEHEFKAFVEQASQDKDGLLVKLPDGNVANRILPVRIHDLDINDIKLCESVLGGVLRGVEFIYKEAGVNRSLTPYDDEKVNLNRTRYRNQLNKVALTIKEIVTGLKGDPEQFDSNHNENLSAIKPVIQEKSIIVLPFENISSDPEQEYFSDGLTEEIITDLSHIHNLLVISRSSAMTFKGTHKKIAEIAGDVNVRYVLEGSVRKSGNNLRITAQLIDGVNDIHIWANKYTGTLEDIFDIQEKVSKSIVSELKLKLSLEEENKVTERPINDIQSFEYYLRAKQEINNFTENSLNKAIDYLQKALEIEGDNSHLYAELAHVYYQFWNVGVRFEETDLERAATYVKKAFEFDSESPDGHFVSGLLECTGGDLRKVFPHFKKVFKTAPNHANALGWQTLIYASLGATEATDQCLIRLSQIDPFSPFINMIPVFLNIFTGEFEVAEKQSIQLGSDDWSRLIRIWTLLYTKKGEAALTEYSTLSEVSKSTYMFRATLLRIYASLKKNIETIQLIDSQFLTWANKDFQYSLFVSEAYALINYKEDALNWIENSVNRGFTNYPFLNTYDPLLENIRNETRFKELMERVKYEWENFEV